MKYYVCYSLYNNTTLLEKFNVFNLGYKIYRLTSQYKSKQNIIYCNRLSGTVAFLLYYIIIFSMVIHEI